MLYVPLTWSPLKNRMACMPDPDVVAVFLSAKPLGLLLIYEPYISMANAVKRPVDHMPL